MDIVQPEKVGFSAARLGRIRPFMQPLVDNATFPGILTLVARQGKIVHYECVGWRDLEAGKPMQEDAIFRIYSMTKPITSVAVMMLCEEGHFRLHDPLYLYLPEFEEIQVAERGPDEQYHLVPPVRPVTIHDLLTHTGGLSYGWDPNHYADKILAEKFAQRGDSHGKNALCDFVRAIAEAPLHHQPGQRFHYSVSTDVLGRLVEVMAGMPFAEFLRRRIFEPLNMPDTDFFVPAGKLERFASMYSPLEENGAPLPGKLKNIDPHPQSDYLRPDRLQGGGGGLVSTTLDYLRFCQMLLNHGELEGVRLLGRKTVELMRMNHLPEGRYMDEEEGVKAHGFGLGGSVLLHPERAKSSGSTGNWGWGGLANTFFRIDFTEQMILIFMTQYQSPMPLTIHDTYTNLVYQAMI